MLLEQLPIAQPPRQDILFLDRDNISEVKPVKYEMPYLSAIGTTDDDVVHCLQELVAKDTSVGDLKAMPEPPLRCPAAIMHYQPEEEAYFRRC